MIRIDGFTMDLALSEGHSFPGEVTQYPVEQGADFSDHIRDLPEEITLECIVSDSPVGAIASDPTRQVSPGPNGLIDPNAPLPSAAALEKLRDIKRRRQPVPIETSLGAFAMMALIDLDVPKDAGKSNGLFFTAKFKKITVVTNRRTKVRVKTPMPGAGGKGKPKATTPQAVTIINSVVIWNHGTPPGGKPNGLSQKVNVRYSKFFGFTQDELVAMGIGGIDSPLNEYTVSGETAPLDGERRAALIADLRRDANTKQLAQLNALSTGLASAPFPKPASGSNLPPGVDLSRFQRPPNPAPALDVVKPAFVPFKPF